MTINTQLKTLVETYKHSPEAKEAIKELLDIFETILLKTLKQAPKAREARSADPVEA